MIFIFNSFILFILFCIKLTKVLIINTIDFAIFAIEYILLKFFFIKLNLKSLILNFFYKIINKIIYIIQIIFIKLFRKSTLNLLINFYNFIKNIIYNNLIHIYTIIKKKNGGDLYSNLIYNKSSKNEFKTFYKLYRGIFNDRMFIFNLFFILDNSSLSYSKSYNSIKLIFRNLLYYYILKTYDNNRYKCYNELTIKLLKYNSFFNYMFIHSKYNSKKIYLITNIKKNFIINNRINFYKKFKYKLNTPFKISILFKENLNTLYKIQYSASNILKYVNNIWLSSTNIQYLRKNKIFNKGRYSRNRQTYRTGVYWCLYINIVAVIAFYFWFYKFSINFGYYWWFFYLFILTFFLSRSLKYKLYNPNIILDEFILYLNWILFVFKHINNIILNVVIYIYTTLLKRNFIFKKSCLYIKFFDYYINYIYNILKIDYILTYDDDLEEYYTLKRDCIYALKDYYYNTIDYINKRVNKLIYDILQ